MGTVFQTFLYFILTVVIGTRIAHVWQTRAAKEARFFDASKDIYTQMVQAAESLSDLAGRRIYATQRVCLTGHTSPSFDKAVSEFRDVVVEWNQRLFRVELSVRTQFRDTYLSTFEYLQTDLSSITREVEHLIANPSSTSASAILSKIRYIRYQYFQFVQGMMKEARTLHRQMHFGVILQYDRYDLAKMSTYDLIKALFTTRVEGQSVVRSPSDFGLPIRSWDARFGIHE